MKNRIFIAVTAIIMAAAFVLPQAQAQPSAQSTKHVTPMPAGFKKTPSLASHPNPATPQLPKTIIHQTTPPAKSGHGAGMAQAPAKHDVMLEPSAELGAPLYMAGGTGSDCGGGQYMINSYFWGPTDSPGYWQGEINNTCVPAEPYSITETATLFDYNNSQIGSASGPNGNIDWKMFLAGLNLPTATGSYNYTARYYRKTTVGSGGPYYFNSPDTLCNGGYDLTDPTPWAGLYYSEECWMSETSTITVGTTFSCNWSYGSINQDGVDDAEFTNNFTCTGAPSGTTTNGTMDWIDWGNNLLGYPEANSTGNSASGFSIDTGMVQFPDQQQIGSLVKDTVILGSGWTWGPGGGCTLFNGNAGVTCTATGNYQTITGNATPTPTMTNTPVPTATSILPTATATAAAPARCNMSTQGWLAIGNNQVELEGTIALAGSSGGIALSVGNMTATDTSDGSWSGSLSPVLQGNGQATQPFNIVFMTIKSGIFNIDTANWSVMDSASGLWCNLPNVVWTDVLSA